MSLTKEKNKEFVKEFMEHFLHMYLQMEPKAALRFLKIMFSGYLYSPYADECEGRTEILMFYNELHSFFSYISNSEEHLNELEKGYKGITTQLAENFV